MPESLKAEAEALQSLRDAAGVARNTLDRDFGSDAASAAERADTEALKAAKDPGKHIPANMNLYRAGRMKAVEVSTEAQAKLAEAEQTFAVRMDETAAERAEMANAGLGAAASVHQSNVEAFIESRAIYLDAIRRADSLTAVADVVAYNSDEQRAARGTRADAPYRNGDGGLMAPRRHVPPVTEVMSLAQGDLTFRKLAEDDAKLAYLLRNDSRRHEDAPPAVRNVDQDGLAEYLRLGAGAVEVSKGPRKGGRVTTL
jgi:hypothetical protein